VSDQRDTVPAPPVPSTNPTAKMRGELEALRGTNVAILREESGLWRGIVIENGVANYHTIELWEAEARAWLHKAESAAKRSAWIPTVCPRCAGVRVTPGLCGGCL